ncbi:MAG TPA: hypothetical protein VD997_16680 [Phycisphaerales bacterium]|nr:hypothetical protein [Phycisphaerales bacterium]
MDYRGVYQDGVIKPDGDVSFPNGTPIEFQPVVDSSREDAIRRADHLAKNPPSLDELAREQGVRPLRSLDEIGSAELFADFDVDEFIRSIKDRR